MTDILGVFHGIYHQPYDSCRKSDTSSGRIFSLGGQLSAPRTQRPTIRIFAAALVRPVGLGFSALILPFLGLIQASICIFEVGCTMPKTLILFVDHPRSPVSIWSTSLLIISFPISQRLHLRSPCHSISWPAYEVGLLNRIFALAYHAIRINPPNHNMENTQNWTGTLLSLGNGHGKRFLAATQRHRNSFFTCLSCLATVDVPLTPTGYDVASEFIDIIRILNIYIPWSSNHCAKKGRYYNPVCLLAPPWFTTGSTDNLFQPPDLISTISACVSAARPHTGCALASRGRSDIKWMDHPVWNI